tara:strand:+ start:1946 stop:3415 length:1470 start_codon:yes stop_codon:yes gene_type:complete
MKINSLTKLSKLRNKYKNLKIGLCHGVFDVLHNGHINHFKDAKKKVDILVVSVTTKKFVNKGPRQPFNNDFQRLNILESIKYIDYVCLNKKKDSKEILKFLKPDIYFKGKDYIKSDFHGNLKDEIKVLKKNKGKIYLTKTKLQSSTKIFNHSYNWSIDQKKYLNKVNKYSWEALQEIFNLLSKKTVNLIGEPIIDKYEYCDIVGTTTKDPAISVLEKKSISIGGGVIAAAKMASQFCKKVNLITYGKPKILKKHLNECKNIKLINISTKQNIQYKRRFINSNRMEKLIQITNFKKNLLSSKEMNKCISELKKVKNENLIICDFGVGLFEKNVLNYLNSSKIKKYLNVQSNSINLGFNFFTKYNKYDYLSLDKREWSLGLKKANLDLNDINNSVKNYKYLAITKGKYGSVFKSKKKTYDTPVFVKSAKDTTGSGDAFFVITSLLTMLNIDNVLIPFIGNVYAGMHSQNIGNYKIVNKNELLSNINSLIKY